jgi:hypothetical protein
MKTKPILLTLLLAGAVAAVASITVEAPSILQRRIVIPAPFAEGIIAAARSQMSSNSLAELPSTNAYRVVGVNVSENGSNWTGVLTYRAR